MNKIDQKIKSIQASIFSILEDYLPSYDEAGESESIQMTFSTCDNLEELSIQLAEQLADCVLEQA